MVTTIRLPHSTENVIVESRQVRSLMNLSIVSMTVKGKVINLTQECARELGAALLDASMAQTETSHSTMYGAPIGAGRNC
ncbi:hypothetical protein [Arthrobacter glacialis]|uniref:Uncharacterized protein n=1 Tax=Arthrobacter glacialis TaxID=1664 RepID=A0A2S3ZT79_ARTGL|nr:hypothetical protein [Arthrobacter glacialis]POH72202.1 hypothetical protein CVS27_17060 [Arthrobacter glacialis]